MSRKNRNHERRSTPHSRGKPTITPIALMLIALIGLAGSAAAQECVWIATDGDWNTGTNWDGGDVPNAPGEWAVIPDDGGSYTIDLNSNTSLDIVRFLNPSSALRTNGRNLTVYDAEGLVNYGTIEANGIGTIDGYIENTPGGEIRIVSGYYLNIPGPLVGNDGTITINDVGTGDAYINFTSPVTIDGTGEVFLNGDDSGDQLYSYYSHPLTQGADHTVRGWGAITCPLTNHGTVIADQPGGFIRLYSQHKSNDGLMTATNGAELRIENINIDNTGGTVSADGGDVFLIGNAHVTGGLLDGTAPSVFHADNGRIGDLTIGSGASIDVLRDRSLFFYGPEIVNNGTIRINDEAAGNSNIDIRDPTTLSGTGEILLNGDDYNDQVYSYYSQMLTHGASHTIRGFGGIHCPFVNHGTVNADDPDGYLRLHGSHKSNDGLMTATNGGELQINSINIDNTGGLILADGGDVSFTSTTITGGTIDRTGSSVGRSYNATFSDLMIPSTGWVDVGTGYNLYLTGSGIVNNGTIRVNHEGTGDAYIDVRDNLSISGTGEILLNGDDHNDRIYGYYGHTLTQESGHTIHGFGGIQNTLVNHGTVDADDPDGYLRLYGSDKTNDGIMRASNGGMLQIHATVNNTDGLIMANGGMVHHAGSITGGDIDGDGSSVMLVQNGWLADLAIAETGWVDVGTGYNLYLTGSGIVNNGTIRVNHEGTGDAYIDVRDNLSISGTGEILLNGDDHNDQIYGYYGHTLTQESGHTIHGFGGIQNTLVNHGTVDADDPDGYLRLYGSDKTNDGIMRASNGGMLQIHATVNNTDGLIMANGGMVHHAGSITGGDIDGDGSSVMLVQNGWLADLAIAETGWVDVGTGYNLYLTGSGIVNNGTIRVNHEGTGDAYIDVRDNLSISGTGEILMNGDDHNDQIYGYYGHTLTQESGHTIHGKGDVRCPFTNRGLVRADSAAYRFRISAHNGFRNEGVCEATGKAMLDVYYAPVGYGGGTLTGGTWVVRDSSLIVFNNARVDTVNASILLDGPGSQIHRDYSLNDGLAGFAKIGPQGDFTIMNRDYAVAGNLMVSGGLNIKPGCTFTVPDDYFQRGGQTAIEGTLTSPNPLVIDYGRMIGNGTVEGDLVSDGWVSPGLSIDVLTVDGTYEQQEHGRLTIELAGTDPSDIDLLDVTGQATLDGMLEVVAADGFLVQPGDMFTVLTCSSRQGEFATVLGRCLAPGVCFDVEYGSDYVRLIAYGLDPADVGDDLVDLPSEIRFYTSSTSAAGSMLHLDLPAAADVDLSIYDVSGRLVSKVWDGAERAGSHTYQWNPNRGSSGIYFARVIVRGTDGAYTKTNRLWVVR